MDSSTIMENPTANHKSEIIAVVIVFPILALFALILRLLSRRLKRISLYYDDYFAITAWVSMLLFMNEGMTANSEIDTRCGRGCHAGKG